MPTRPQYHRPRHAPTLTADQERGTATSRGYDRAWRKLRDSHLSTHPLCEVCESRGYTMAASVVDHRVPVAVDPSRRLDPTNLRSCCVPCHAELTTNFRTKGVNEPNAAAGGASVGRTGR